MMKLIRRNPNTFTHLSILALIAVSLSGCAPRETATTARDHSAAATSAEPVAPNVTADHASAQADDTVLLFVAADEDSFHGVWTWVKIDAEAFPTLKLESTTYQKVPELMDRFNLTTIPAYIIFKNGTPVTGFNTTDRNVIWQNVEKYTLRKS